MEFELLRHPWTLPLLLILALIFSGFIVKAPRLGPGEPGIYMTKSELQDLKERAAANGAWFGICLVAAALLVAERVASYLQ